MDNKKLFLRQNVKVEPLFNHWYAWPHLIAPATAAMNITFHHLKIMGSYVNAPQVHASAVKNPAMLGGPFIDYGGGRVDEVKELMEKTKVSQANLITFAEAIKTLDTMLQSEAKGETLEPLYPRIPDVLKGYVELVYDLNNQPSIRFFESLLYQSQYYDPSLQSIALSLIHQDERPFVLSTPRLMGEDTVHLKIPFSHPGLNELFRMKETPQTYSFIKEKLGIEDRYDELFQSFLTDEAPKKRAPYDGDAVKVTYLGHACILVETKDLCLLTDPVLSYRYPNCSDRLTFLDLPQKIDYVLITHPHQDHLMFETLLQIRHKVKNIVVPRNSGGALQDPSLRLILKHAGFEHVIELDPLDSIPIPEGSLTALPFIGEHGDLNIHSKTGHLIHVKDHSLLCAADSCNISPEMYQHIHRILGDIEVLFLGMECEGAPLSWLYGPLLTKPLNRKMDFSRTFSGSDYKQAIGLVNEFKCKHVYVYAMGQEPWMNYIMSKKYTDESKPIVESNRLIEECRSRGVLSERLVGQKEIFL